MNEAKSLSEGMLSRLESSVKRISMDIYEETLVRTLNWLSEDRDDVLAVLSGPKSFHAPLPWSIIGLAQRAFTSSKLPKAVQQRRTRACLRALYYIPGAIRDVLAPYAAEKHYFLEILPLLNSSESLGIIELWDSPDVDLALSVRCAAAVVAAFMPLVVCLTFSSPVPISSGKTILDSGQRFLSERLRIVRAGADGGAIPEFGSQDDNSRLQNLVHFLEDIANTLGYMDTGTRE
ncbi:hypothetical protein EDB92DRAFT_1994845 [Lactarius akahatsu]|uniref:Uncharacterized protein n=1 Tax=Lactarius akahatsu TaxID=416441 RepID=A0AAD4LJV8_9AGAM|nr:hypothetical protein EDB92DRAFT_1994845 [Lactarius akahatsu]